MKTKLIVSFLMVFALFSCKKETKPTETEAKKEEVSKIFKVTLDVKVSKDDTFHLFYTEDGSINFNEESSIWVELKGSPQSQKVVFNLPENTIPTQLRLDFGINKLQDDIIINNFSMYYAGKTFEAPSSKFFDLFRPNELVVGIDPATNTIKPIKKEGQAYGPSFYPREDAVTKQIELLVK